MILSSHLRLGLSSGLFPSYFPTKIFYAFLISPMRATCAEITNSIGQSPSWEADSRSANQEFPRLLRNPKVHYRVHKSLPLVLILSQLNSDHVFIPATLILHSHPRQVLVSSLSQWSLPTKYYVHFSFLNVYHISLTVYSVTVERVS